MTVIGQLVSQWNATIIAHLSGADYLSDHSIFSTLGSVTLTAAHEMARAIYALLQLYGWQRVHTSIYYFFLLIYPALLANLIFSFFIVFIF